MKTLATIAVLVSLAPSVSAEVVDRVVASVGRQVVTLSDVVKEDRVACFLDGRALPPLDPAHVREVAGRLVDQLLIRREMEVGSIPLVSVENLEPRMQSIRAKYKDAGAYRAALARCELEEAVLSRSVGFQIELLDFIDLRVRPGLQVAAEEIEKYYNEEFAPEVRKRGESAPPLESVRERIVAILTEREVNQRLAVWIAELRAQRPIRIR